MYVYMYGYTCLSKLGAHKVQQNFLDLSRVILQCSLIEFFISHAEARIHCNVAQEVTPKETEPCPQQLHKVHFSCCLSSCMHTEIQVKTRSIFSRKNCLAFGSLGNYLTTISILHLYF